ncbi:hydrolase [Mycobacterium kubicae]|uniref:Hydrolase n=1 Tax=Mycobacterium kubicae TaxID=120959 RepID=A0AAX1JAR4_9MYCO|nr:alpha/beta fold hydrolase [Mycobacterium kubicae]MCV7094509.1 alpha/beta fold hydrolase [Mycobacterium kubicae]QNI14015.1 alpha/beta fold hydrolase [Mycobacterium kubicae]QPI37527.1 alpha/beta fold hydrolase [Mycobacterium kubicae]GFG66200.1 hydrolase [Mycobacterium kubicae]
MTNLHTINLHGDRVAYRDEGAGEVLLLIHGMGGNSNNWRKMIPVLSKNYRVIAPDLLGHGQTDKPRGDYSLGAFAVWLRDFLDALGIPRVTVIGHSLGGGIAMQFTHQHRDYCERLILLSSGGLGGEVNRALRLCSLPGSEFVLQVAASKPVITARKALSAIKSADRDLSEHWEAHTALANPENRQAFLRTLRAVVDRRGQAVCALNRLHANGNVPVMIISGDQDRVIPIAHAYAAHQAMPHSRLHILPGVSHHPHTEQPEAVASLIDDFIGTEARTLGAADSRRTGMRSEAMMQRMGSARSRHLHLVRMPDESRCG